MRLHPEGELVGHLYDAALGHRAWTEIGPELVNLIDGQTLLLSVHGRVSGAVDLVATHGLASRDLRDYGEYYAQHDLWARAALADSQFGRAHIGEELVDLRSLEGSLFYNDFLRPRTNIHHVVGSLLALEGDSFGVVGIHRPRDGAAYEPPDTRRLERMLPHLQRALEMRQKIGLATAASQSLLAALDRLSVGVALLGATGKIIHANTRADAILGGGDGLARVPDGVRASGRDDDRRLQALIAGARQTTLSGTHVATSSAAQGAGGHLSIARPSGRRAYAVMVAPVGRDVRIGADLPALLLFITDPDAGPAIPTEALEQLFDFTPAEARLVRALASGVALPDFARQAGLSYNTVRTLLARAMTRSETSSQLQLVRLVLGALPGIGAGAPPESDGMDTGVGHRPD